jgi:hypothetical protein
MRKRLLLLCLTVALISIWNVAPTRAQNEPAPNARVRLYDVGQMNSTIATFAPNSTEALDKEEIYTGVTRLLSPDRQWSTDYGIQLGAKTSTFNYTQAGGTPVEVAIPEGYFVGWVQFSTDSKYLGAAFVDYTNKKWITASIELATGATRKFGGNFEMVLPNAAITPVGTMLAPKATNTPEAPEVGAIKGAAFPIGWGDDGKTFYVSPFNFSLYSFAGLYRIDLSKTDAGTGDPSPLPPAELVIPASEFVGAPLVAPDGETVVFAANDPANPPVRYQALQTQTSITANVFKAFNLKTGETKTLYSAKTGEGMAGAAWSQDGKTLYFVTGGYNDSYYIATPRLVGVDVTSGDVTEGDTLTLDQDSSIFSLLACSDSIFVTIRQAKDITDPNAKTYLHSLPLSDLGKLSDVLATSNAITMLGCVPAK